MSQAVETIAQARAELAHLSAAGSIRPEAQDRASGLAVLLAQAEEQAQAESLAEPLPLDVRVAELADKLDTVAAVVHEIGAHVLAAAQAAAPAGKPAA